MENLPMEQYVPDAMAYRHLHGSDDGLRLNTAGALAGEREGWAVSTEFA
jgi:hypothetical protein